MATKKTITAKPSKIVAGQEPEKTNELLQIIGGAIQGRVDSKKAIEEWRNRQQQGNISGGQKVKKTVRGVTKEKSNLVTVEKTKPSPKSRDESEMKVIDGGSAGDAEKKSRVDSGIVEDGQPATIEESQSIEHEQSQPPVETNIPTMNLKDDKLDKVTNDEPIKSIDLLDNRPPSPPPPSIAPEVIPLKVNAEQKEITPAPISNGVADERQDLINIIDEEAAIRRKKKSPPVRKPSSDKLIKANSQEVLDGKSKEAESIKKPEKPLKSKEPLQNSHHPPALPRPRTSLRPPSVRPASARPGAPRKRDKNVEVVIKPNENVQLGEINVKLEQFKANPSLDDDDDNLIVIENLNIQEQISKHDEQGKHALDTDPLLISEANQGHLVQQILETQKEFATGQGDGNKSDSVGNKNPNNNVISGLRDQIQKLTKSVQPLGRFMDFLLEDIDSMQREYEMWRERGKEVGIKLARERNATEGTVRSLRHQLEELDVELKERESATFAVRENLLANEEKILKLFKTL